MKRCAVFLVLISLGCSSIPDVQPEDLDRLTNDLQKIHDGIARIDTSYLDPQVAGVLDDVRVGTDKAAKVSDLFSRIRRANK